MNFPRPENNMASEKMNLWILPTDDENYRRVYENIEAILDQNLTNIESTLDIYEKYAYLLKEMDKAMGWAS